MQFCDFFTFLPFRDTPFAPGFCKKFFYKGVIKSIDNTRIFLFTLFRVKLVRCGFQVSIKAYLTSSGVKEFERQNV